ncbi:cytochrome b-c1 complex subunit 8 [Panaeolus papilionaceus]|nr:cytochrome b-c1 complex subunit 8 [Panaeolus papilionaceus]
MRPTLVARDGMPGPRNLWWGDKSGVRQKGMVTYTLSPFQTKAAPHWLRSYIFNGYRRISGELLFFGLPFAIGYGVYAWAKSYDNWQNSKAGHIAQGEHHE